MANSNTAMNTRLDGLAHDLRSAIEQSTNSLSAYIGEIEDRLERTGGSLKQNPSRNP
jgi:hypothetical protein